MKPPACYWAEAVHNQALVTGPRGTQSRSVTAVSPDSYGTQTATEKDSVLSTEAFGGPVTISSEFATILGLQGVLDILESHSMLQVQKWNQVRPRKFFSLKFVKHLEIREGD